MHGATVTKMQPDRGLQRILCTPEMAAQLLEHNDLNRPLNDQHVQRIANQILAGKWRFNGDTIKVAHGGGILDGQHRLWAIFKADKSVETIIVRGIERDAFATIDTLRKPRSGADTLALCGASRYRNVMASALQWLVRWQRGILLEFKAPQNRIENSDVEAAYAAHPNIMHAVERAMQLRGLANPSIVGFLFYICANRNVDVADRMMSTLENPAGVSVDDAFFRLRAYFLADHHKRKEPLMTIALAIKAMNAASENKKIKVLSWKNQGKAAEPFPKLLVKQ